MSLSSVVVVGLYDDYLTGIATSAADATAPTLTSAVVAADGDSITLSFSEAVEFGAGGNGGFALTASGGASTMTYSSGAESTQLVYTLSRTIEVGETVTLAYTQPTNGVEDAAGNDLASFSGQAVTVPGDTRIATIFVSDPVPASAQTRGGIAYAPTGEMYVAELSGAEVAYLAGRAIRADGALIISTGTIAVHLGGVGLTASGETVVSTSAPDLYHQGKPLLEDGKLCVSEAS